MTDRLEKIKEFVHVDKVTGRSTDYSLFRHADVEWLLEKLGECREALEEIAKPPYKDSDIESLLGWCRARAERVLDETK